MAPIAHLFTSIRLWLETFDPAAPWYALAGFIWLVVYTTRRYAPGVWDTLKRDNAALSNVLQALPGTLLSVAIVALGKGLDPKSATLGVLSSAAAALFHHILKAAPIAYASKPKADGKTKPKLTLVGLVLLAIGLGGCADRSPAHPTLEDLDPVELACTAQATAIKAEQLKLCDGQSGGCPETEADQIIDAWVKRVNEECIK